MKAEALRKRMRERRRQDETLERLRLKQVREKIGFFPFYFSSKRRARAELAFPKLMIDDIALPTGQSRCRAHF